jgi:hypothetical protein
MLKGTLIASRFQSEIDPLEFVFEFLFGAIEIAEVEVRKLFLKQRHHFRDSHPASSSHRLEVEIRIDIEISHLNEIEARRPDQLDQSFDFFLSICESRKDKEVDRSIEALPFRFDQGVNNRPKREPSGFVIAPEESRMGTVERDANAIKPGIAESLDSFREASVGVQVNRSPIGLLPHLPDRPFQEAPLHQRLSFTTLSETDDCILCLLEVGHGNAQDLINRGDKADSFLGGGTAFRGLERDAADAFRIAGRRRGQRTLPSPEEDILGCKAVIFQGTSRELPEKSVLGFLFQEMGDLPG